MRLLPTWAWIGIGAGLLTWVIARRAHAAWRRKQPFGFGWFLRHPEDWDAVERHFAATQRGRAAAKSWSDARVAAAVRRFVLDVPHSSEDDDLGRQLQEQPARAAHHALQVLLDPSLQERLRILSAPDPAKPRSLLPESPAERACTLFGEHGMVAAIPALLQLLQDPDNGTRQGAALALGRTGDPAAVEGMRGALADANEYVRHWLVIGLQRAESAGQLARDTRERMIEPLLDAALAHLEEDAASVAAKWNAQAALARFRAAGLLTAGAPLRGMRLALEALTEANTLLPRDEVLHLWRDRPLGDEYFVQKCRAAIVRMLAAHGHTDDDAMLRELMQADSEVAEAAAKATMQRVGLGDLDKRLGRKVSERARLNAAERRYIAMWELDCEVRNGGFSQYFFNSSGGDWEAALEGFVAQDPARAQILRDLIALLAEPPSRNRQERQRQLAPLYARSDRVFDAFERRYYDGPPIRVVLARHAIANSDDLRA